MKPTSIILFLLIFIYQGCNDKKSHQHHHRADDLEPLAYTIYSEKTELFVEFKPLIVGKTSRFAAHFTILGENFLPMREGKVSVRYKIGENELRNHADSPASPGIFRLALKPTEVGIGKLIFDIVTDSYSDQIIIENIRAYPDKKTALKDQKKTDDADEITYLKEQAWKVEFANLLVSKQNFTDVIKTDGHIQSAPGDEVIVTANTNGTVLFSNNHLITGAEVSTTTLLFTISGGDISKGTIETAFKEAKANLEKANADYERTSELVKDQIVSKKEHLHSKVAFEKAQTTFEAVTKNYSTNGQTISSPISGFIKEILIQEGQFVITGAPLAIISKNKKLLLKANLSQRYFEKLPIISGANFKLTGSNRVYDVQELKGKLLSFGKSASEKSPFIPVTFEIENSANIIAGSIVEVYLKSTPIPNALVVPVSALLEEQGYFYVYVQSSGEGFQKREVKIGARNGKQVQLISGVSDGERVVTKGAYQIKLSSASGELPAHGHEH